MRAAFIAAQSGRQTVVLTPTTLLAQQHYQNFCDRFAGFPINIEMISRFRSAKQQQKILADLANGTIDIIIGTHKLLQSEIKFKNLGLLVIDEEHRFGVRQKERIKALRTEIDILTLTATPIPRTLNMAFAGIRDLSLIATPPQRRLAIKTFITEYNQPIIREAVLREILRGGQVYYLHNDVATIQKTVDDLTKLIPEAKINFAHGQMHERQLERIMVDFYHRRFNLLVCTTIIESGIDIPSANTIIMERADKLGLAQLHQLRGRVGRSHHQAYAYLLTPQHITITKDAQKRLDAIGSLEDLGMGFTLATHDMEIRGAGEFLGEEQSGHIQEIGFDLYMEMLERAIQNIKAGKSPNLEQPLSYNIEIDLQITNLIPDDYVHDINTRLTLYKRIASAPNDAALTDLRVEMIDRFGLLPVAAQNLFLLRELKLRAEQLGIIKIEGNSNNIRLTFSEPPKINPEKIINLIQTQPQKFRFDGTNKLKYLVVTDTAAERIKAVGKTLIMINDYRRDAL
jgi:transcription-repair coupling factor (superfamily II helicase)